MSVPRPNLLRLAAPIVVSFWMRSAFNLVDTAYASFLGDAAIAAIGLTLPLEFVMIACWVGSSSWLTSVLSRAMGAGEGERIEQALRQVRTVIAVLVAGFLAIAAGCWFFYDRLGLEPEVAAHFRIYATVLMGGSALTAFWSIVPDSIVKAHHDTRATMMAGIWSNVINLTLNTVFLFAFGWGIFGIALSTVIGRIGGLVYALRAAGRHEGARLTAGGFDTPGRDPRPWRTYFTLALPAALSFSLMATEGLAINGLLAHVPESTAAITAYSVYHKALMFLAMPIFACTVAMLPFVGRLVGESAYDEIRAGFRQVLGAAVGYVAVVVAPTCWLAAEPLAEALCQSPEAISRVVFAFRWTPLIVLALAPVTLVRPAFEGLGMGGPVARLAIGRYVLLALPLAVAGIQLAPRFGHPPFHGLIVGALISSAVVSAIGLAWMWRVLTAAERDAASSATLSS